MKFKITLFFALIIANFNILIAKEVCSTRFAIVIASYNNENYCRKNLLSALNQNYENFYIVFINDNSADNTLHLAKQIKKRYDPHNKITIVNNKTRQRSAYNYYHAIHKYSKNDDVVVILDGDDQLAHSNVLSKLNDVYTNPKNEIWMTYGQFRELSSGNIGFCADMPLEIVRKHMFRKYHHIPSHLKTFKSWLFKKVKQQDLMYEGKFLPMTWDMAAMIPMIEMAAKHYYFIPQVLYLYNDQNPINDHKVSKQLQRTIDLYVRSLPVYKPLD